MKKSRTVASLVLNLLAFLILLVILASFFCQYLGVEGWPSMWPAVATINRSPRHLLYLFVYVADGFLGIALLAQIILDIVRLKKSEVKGKFWVYCKNSATVSAVSAAIFTVIVSFLYKDPIAAIEWNGIGHNVYGLIVIAPVLALISGLFTEFTPKTPFVLTLLYPVVAYAYLVMNALFGVFNWGLPDGFAGYPFFDYAHVELYVFILSIVGTAVGSYLVGVICWLIQHGLARAEEKSEAKKEPKMIVEEVPAEPAVEETPSPALEAPASPEPAPQVVEEPDSKPEDVSEQTPVPAVEETPSPALEAPAPIERKKVILVKKPNRELADAYREEPLPKGGRVTVAAPKKAAAKDETKIDGVTITSSDPETEEAEERAMMAAEKTKGIATYNNRPRVYHVSRQPDSGKWQVKLATGVKAIRLFATQEEAIAYARGLAKSMGGSIRVHSVKGKMRKD